MQVKRTAWGTARGRSTSTATKPSANNVFEEEYNEDFEPQQQQQQQHMEQGAAAEPVAGCEQDNEDEDFVEAGPVRQGTWQEHNTAGARASDVLHEPAWGAAANTAQAWTGQTKVSAQQFATLPPWSTIGLYASC